MNKLYVCLALLPILFNSCHSMNDAEVNATMCNPLPLNYDFTVEEGVSRRDGENAHKNGAWIGICGELAADTTLTETFLRSEERRVGKECRSRWSPYH